MAEALLGKKGGGRFEAASAGSHPVARVNPLAVEALATIGIEWRGHAPRGMDGLECEHWDFVITVCDRAKERCPILPGQPVQLHWGIDDPADAAGTREEQFLAFTRARDILAARIDEFLSVISTSIPAY